MSTLLQQKRKRGNSTIMRFAVRNSEGKNGGVEVKKDRKGKLEGDADV